MKTFRTLLTLIAGVLAAVPRLEAQSELTVARRVKMVIADFESPEPEGSLFAGRSVAETVEQYALESPQLLEKVILVRRSEGPADLSGLRLDDILGVLKRTETWKVETVLVGRVSKAEDGRYRLVLQVVDIQKKNIPATRRILNHVDVDAIPPTAEGLEAACRQAVATLAAAQFPRVDIITPNFDVVSIRQIDKDNFPEIRLTVSVVNAAGEPVSVPPDLFEVRENGNMVLAEVRKIKAEERAFEPLTVVLVIDRSPSMLEEPDGRKTGEPFRRAKAAAREFVRRLSPRDRLKIVAFDYEPLDLGDFTTNHAEQLRRLDGLEVGRGTGLFYVVQYAVRQLENVKGQKAVILLTDGKNDVRRAPDHVKNATLEEGLELARKLSIPVYTIGFGDADWVSLRRIAEESHAIFFKAAGSEQLRELYLKLHNIIENQYIITYRSLATHSGKVTVDLNIRRDERAFELSAEEQAAASRLRSETDAQRRARLAEQERREIEAARRELQQRAERLEAERKSLEQSRQQLERRERELASMRSNLARQEETLRQRQNELAEQQRRAESLRQELEQRQKELAEQQRRTETLRQELEQRQASLTEEQRRNASVRQELEQRQKELAEQQRRTEALRQELEQRQKELAEQERQADRLREELDQRRKTVEEAEKRNADLRRELEERNRQAEEEARRIAQARARLREIEANIRRTNDEILEFLRQKLEYIRQEQEKLDRMEGGAR